MIANRTSPLRRAVGRVFRQPVRHFTIVWLILLHGGLVYYHVGKLDPDLYRRHAVELRAMPRWRYGYTRAYHGAHLCKTRNVQEADPSSPVGDDAAPDKDLAADTESPMDDDLAADDRDSADEGLTGAMMGRLDGFPRKAWFEALFFAGMVGYAFWLAPWLWRKLAPVSGPRVQAACVAAVLLIIGWMLFLLPLLVSGYGATLYTTYAGPGAMSISGPYPGMITGLGGETISYRPLLELVCVFPLLFVQTTGIGYRFPRGTASFLLVAGLTFWGLLGAIVSLVRQVWIRSAMQAKTSLTHTAHRVPDNSEDELPRGAL